MGTFILKKGDLRDLFPYFSTEEGRQTIYLDNAATTQKPYEVIEAVTNTYRHGVGGVGRSLHHLADRSFDQIEVARREVAQFLGDLPPETIAFNSGTTAGINQVAYGFVLPRLHKGQSIWASVMDHHSNLFPWREICAQRGAELRLLPLDKQGRVDVALLANQLNSDAAIVVCPHLSNLLGVVNPIEEIAKITRAKGVPLLVDAAQSVGHTAIDIKSLGGDFWVFSAHKIYGPTGVGVLYAALDYHDQIQPFHWGGGMLDQPFYKINSPLHLAPYPQSIEAGTPHIAGINGLKAAIGFLKSIGWQRISSHENQLAQHARAALSQIRGLQILYPDTPKIGLLSFSLKGDNPTDLALWLSQHKIALRSGAQCAGPLVDYLGCTEGVLRISWGVYNTTGEIDRLAEKLKHYLNLFGQI